MHGCNSTSTEWGSTTVLQSIGCTDNLELSKQFTIRRKQKHDHDLAWKLSLKYKKQRLEACYGSSVVNSPDYSYGSLPAEPDIPQNDYFSYVLNALREYRRLPNK